MKLLLCLLCAFCVVERGRWELLWGRGIVKLEEGEKKKSKKK